MKPVVGGGFSSTALNETDLVSSNIFDFLFKIIYIIYQRGRTPLMLACIYGRFEVMEELLNANVDVHARDDVSYY